MPTFEPAQYGKYFLLDKIATGGMAELFKAKLTGAEGFEKLIAIKKILQHLNTEEKLVDSFIDEAKLAAHLQHPNIVQIYDFGSLEETYYIAMEFLFGKDLRFVMKKAGLKDMPMPLEDALFITAQLCSGLDYAHTLHDFKGNPLSIIHRDIGPQNIFITYSGQVKIIDFGIAKAATQNTNTQVGTIKGKVAYMSPEQAGGEIIDRRSDIFSAGIVLYELLTNRKMYEGDTFQVLAKAREALFEPLENINTSLPDEIYHILKKALRKDPDLRYQTAEEMCNDIEMYIQKHSIRASQKELSGYMKRLFMEEVEESDFRSVVSGKPVHSQRDEDKTFITGEERNGAFEDTAIEGDTRFIRKWSWKRILFYSAALAASLLALMQNYGVLDTIMQQMHGVLKYHSVDSAEPLVDIVAIDKGRQLVDEKRYKESVAVFEEILEHYPDSLELFAPSYSGALTSIGTGLMKSNPQEAEKYLVKAIEVNPKNSDAFFLLGRVNTGLKNDRKAVECYSKAAELDPDNPDIYFNLGYSYAVQYNYGEAKEMYLKVVELAPPFIDEALFNLALIQEKTGERKLAIDNLKKAISVNPRNKNAVNFLKKLNRNSDK